MARRNRRDKKIQQNIARKRIERLLHLSEQRAHQGDLHLADRYIYHARKISMKHIVPIPLLYRRSICKNCYCYLLPTKTSTVRLNHGHLTITCHSCGHQMRIPYHDRSARPPKDS